MVGVRYRRPTAHSSCCSARTAPTRRRTAGRLARIHRCGAALGLEQGVRAVGRDGPRSIPINGAGGGLWLSLGAPMAVLGSGAGAGSAGQHAGEDNREPGRCDSVGRLGSLVDVVRRRRCRQAGNGRARNRARARVNWVSQGQPCGRCKVRRRAERVSRPAREKKRRRRVLVVTTPSPRPMRAVQRAGTHGRLTHRED